MFTSGTTGSPKGVMVSTGNVSAFISAMRELYPFSPGDRVSQTYDFTFDPSVMDMFTTWSSGASLHVVPATQLMGPSRFIREHELTCWFSVPSTIAFMRNMKMLTPGAFPLVRYSIFCGEPLPASSAELWQKAAPNSFVDNLYGPTEATVVCIGQRCTEPMVSPKAEEPSPSASPLAATIRDRRHQPPFPPSRRKGRTCSLWQASRKRIFQRSPKDRSKISDYRRQKMVPDRRLRLPRCRRNIPSPWTHRQSGEGAGQSRRIGRRRGASARSLRSGFRCGRRLAHYECACRRHRGLRLWLHSHDRGNPREDAAPRPKYMVPTEVRFLPRLPVSVSGKTDRKALTEMLAQGSV